jgi:hypothetical protein
VHGTAQDAAGKPLPLDQIEQRIVANKQAFDLNGRRTLRADSTGTADGVLAYDAPGSVNWTATYTGLSPADQTRATTNETRALWLGANPLVGNEGTIFEVSLDGSIVPGPATPDCTAPFAQNAIGGVSIGGTPTKLINQSNVGGTLTISGPYDPGNVNGAGITVTAGGVPAAVTSSAAGTWSATVPAASLPEGNVSLVATFPASAGGSGAPDNTMTIVKDTLAPAAPTSNLGSGTYTGAQTITLQGDPGATIRFTSNGAAPTATSGAVFSSPFSVTASQTIRAVAVDNNGNVSPVSTFAFTIVAPGGAAGGGAVGGVIPGAGGVGAGGVAGAAGQGIAGVSSTPLTVGNLTTARSISRAGLRARGLRASMNVQQGTRVVRIAVYRARNGQKRGRALFVTTRAVRSAGLLRVTLRNRSLRNLRAGQYVLQVRAGRSQATLGTAASIAFRVR